MRMKSSLVNVGGCLALCIHGISAINTLSDAPYEEVMALRQTFGANTLNFPELPFQSVKHICSLQSSKYFAILTKTGQLYSMSSNVSSGPEGTIPITITTDVTLEGSCLMSGEEDGILYLISPQDSGVFQLACDYEECQSITKVASFASDIADVSSCSLSSYSSDGGGVVVAAASPEGYFVANIPSSSSSDNMAKMVLLQHKKRNQDDMHKTLENSLFKSMFKPELATGSRPSSASYDDSLPPSEEIDSISVFTGWTDGGGGLALALTTKDHLWYTTSYEDSIPTSSDIVNELVWRDEWITSPDWYGGAVDFRIPRYGLQYQPRSQGTAPVLWLGGAWGLQSLDLDLQIFRRYNGVNQKLPYQNLTVVAPSTYFYESDTASSLWLGTDMGLSLRQGQGSVDKGSSEWRYMYGPRYLPGLDGHIEQVAVLTGEAQCGGCSDKCNVPTTPTALVLTEDGLSLIETQCWKLSDKATFYEDMVNPRHDRYGLVGSCGLSTVNDLSTYVLKDSDNDGLWTSIYTSSQVLKAASLAQESAQAQDQSIPSANFNASLAQVEEHFAALKKLFDVTGMTGSMARSYALYGDEPLGPVPGDDNKRAWYNSTTYPGWIWKGDTSSDEVSGHMFIYGLIASVVPETLPEDATPTQQAYFNSMSPIRTQAVQLIEDFNTELLNNGLTLIDPGTGEPTTWGRWDPETLNDNREYSDERGTNAVQLLSFLRNAAVVTGNATFDDAADQVKQLYGYGINARNARITTPGDINYSDDELLLLPYFAHLVLSDDAAVKDLDMVCSFARTWMEGVAGERSTLWATMHGVIAKYLASSEGWANEGPVFQQWMQCGGSTLLDAKDGSLIEAQPVTPRPDVDQLDGIYQEVGDILIDSDVAVWGLKNWPLDLVSWGYLNSQRSDICLDPTAFKAAGKTQSTNKVLPQNERSPNRWNSDPYSLDGGLPGGTSEEDPGAFLLPYWMARYNNML